MRTREKIKSDVTEASLAAGERPRKEPIYNSWAVCTPQREFWFSTRAAARSFYRSMKAKGYKVSGPESYGCRVCFT